MRFFVTDKNFPSRHGMGETSGGNTVALVLLVAATAAIRLYALHNTAVLNPDGPLYIHQAKAIANGEWEGALCTLPFLSNTSLLISLFHLVLGDWLTAARTVSLLFGTLAVVPLHGLFRQFFPRADSLAAAAVLAFLPTWVSNSVDVVRDPVCWFFSLHGLYWLVAGVRGERPLLLSLACVAFLLAGWARIEALWYAAAACLLLPLLLQRRRATTLLWFTLPVLAGAALLAMAPLWHGPSLLTLSRLGELRQTMAGGLPQYEALREALAALRQPGQEPLLFYFLPEARNLIWLIGLGTVINRLCEALTYPFTLLALLGIGPLLHRSRDKGLALFFCLLALGAMGLLYLRTLQTWIMEYRYLMLAILPASLCFCAGLSALAERLSRRVGLARGPMLALFAGALILATLPRDLTPRGEAEIAMKEIGLFLAANHPADDEVRVATSAQTVRLVRFYANQGRPGIPCPERPEHLYPSLTGDSTDALVTTLRERRIDYLLWEEYNRPAGWPLAVIGQREKKGALQELGRWQNPQTGELVLYRVTPKPGQ